MLDIKTYTGEYILSRINFRKICSEISDSTVLDFKGIVFITRSVADELCELIERNKKITVTGMNPIVSQMYQIVRISRTTPRQHELSEGLITYCKDMEDVKRLFTH